MERTSANSFGITVKLKPEGLLRLALLRTADQRERLIQRVDAEQVKQVRELQNGSLLLTLNQSGAKSLAKEVGLSQSSLQLVASRLEPSSRQLLLIESALVQLHLLRQQTTGGQL